MTKPQIWVAAFLGLFLLLFVLQRAVKKDEPVTNPGMGPMMQEQTTSSKELSDEELFGSFGCVNCHGADLAGTKLGPPLKNLKQFWGRDNLINYLRNPNSFMSSDRFKEYRKQYTNQMMPSFGNKNVKDLGKIADYLLTQ
jgi:mono/diheme cytochrome c family protein